MNYGSHGQLRAARTVRDSGTASSFAIRLWQQLAIVSELAVRQRYHAPWNPTGAERPRSRSERIDVA